MHKVNLEQKFSKIREYWKPYIAAELNGQQVKLDKLKGSFVWHRHADEDEMFLVVKGRFRLELREAGSGSPIGRRAGGVPGKARRERKVWLEEGEFIVVPHGVEHRPVAEEEAWVVLFEPVSTLNTGNVANERSLPRLEHI